MRTNLNAPHTLWGSSAIGRAIGCSPRQALHFIDRHGLPAFKVGRMLGADSNALQEWLSLQQARGANR